MIFSKLFKRSYYTQNNINILNNITYFLSVNNYIYNDKFIKLDTTNNQEALYSFYNNFINIPKNFYRSDKNYLQFEAIQKHLGDKTLEFIIKHEFGHLNHHQFLSIKHNINSENFEYVTLNSNSNYIHTNTALDKLFDRTLSKPNPIEDFLHMNFMESYADAYAGIISYFQDKDKNFFAKIHNLRLTQFKELKNSDKLTIKQNSDNKAVAEIYSGKFSTSRYSNYLSSKYIKENILENFSFNKLNKLSIYDLHNLIQIEVLSSLQETFKKEIKNNYLFNKQCKDYLQEKNISISDYLKQFNNGIIEYKKINYLNIIHNELLSNNQDKLNQFINFHANNKEFKPSYLFKSLLNIEQEQTLYETIQNLKNNNRLNENKNGLSKYIINNFILPSNSLSSLIEDLRSNNISTIKNKEIIQSLDNDTKNYLINSYNESVKVKSEEIPQLNNYSQDKLIKIFINDLSDKNKKEFIKLQTQYSIKEISTPYLSSSFNANVLNNDVTIKYQQEKSNYLINIKKFKAQINYSNKEITQIKP